MTGKTGSSDFPTTPGAFQTSLSGASDIFVTKLNPTGSALIYSTYLGGIDEEADDHNDQPTRIVVDSSGLAYITGTTQSIDFPTTPGAFDRTCGTDGLCNGEKDIFVTKLNVDGTGLVYSTYIGGSDVEQAGGIAIDSFGYAYIAGTTESGDFPTTLGAFDTVCAVDGDCVGKPEVFVTKLTSEGSALIYSTFIGGTDSEQVATGIAVDSSGNAYITGVADSDNLPDGFPTTPGAFQTSPAGRDDAFVTKLNSTGSGLIYSTFIGGSDDDQANGVAVDSLGNAYVTGRTRSLDFPVTSGVPQAFLAGGRDAFVTKVNLTGSALVYSMYVGGSSNDEATAIALDLVGNTYVAGNSFSPNFPTTPGAFQVDDPFQSGPGAVTSDGFIVKITESNTPVLFVHPKSVTVQDWDRTPNVGNSTDMILTVRNSSGGTLTGNVSTSVPFSIVGDSTFNLGPGQHKQMTIRFSPTSLGIFQGNVNISSDAGNMSVSLTATTAGPIVQPQSWDFGLIALNSSSVKTFTFQNLGNGTLTGNASTAAPFSVVGDNTFNLAPGQIKEITIRFSPTLEGHVFGSINFSGNGIDWVVPLSGRAPVVLKTGDIIVADSDAFGGGAIINVDPVTGAQTVISLKGSFHAPCGIAVEANGNLLIGDSGGSGVPGKIIRVNPVTGQQTVLSVGGGPCGIALEASQTFVVADIQQNAIIRFDSITGAQTVLSSGGALILPHDVAIDASGNILVAVFGPAPGPGSIIRIDPVTGSQTIVSSGGSFVHPWYLAIAGNGDIFVTDENTRQILRVNPVTGTQTFVSTGRPSGSPLISTATLSSPSNLPGRDCPQYFELIPSRARTRLYLRRGSFLIPSVWQSSNQAPLHCYLSVRRR